MIARRGRAVAAAVLLALASALPAHAQADPPFVVERPSFSTPPDVVGRGFWQIEAGVAWERDAVAGDDARTTVTVPNSIVRLGVTTRLELRFATTGLVSSRLRDARETSAADIELGAKYQIASQADFGVDLSVVPMVSLPTGGGAASSRNADPSLIVTANRAFGAPALNLNLKWSAPSVGDDASSRARVLDWSAVLAFPLRGAWGAFVEGVATDVDIADVPTQWTANAGLGRQIGANLLLDVFAGRGLNDAAPDWTVGAGLGWRFRR